MILDTSAVKEKQKSAYCKEPSAMNQDLLPGRECVSSSQCESSICTGEKEKQKYCLGRKEGQHCAKHEDCKQGTYCGGLAVWPFDSTCQDYKLEGTECAVDHEC